MGDIAGRAAGSAIAKVGVSIVEKLVGKTTQAIKDQFTQIDLWSEYERKYIDRYGKVKLTFSGMWEAVPLEQIYTGVRFLDGLSIGRFASIETLEQGFRKKARRFQQHECRLEDGITVANEHPFLMVLGGPGAGKSTFLRRVGIEALKGKRGQFQHERIPVMLELKRFDSEEMDWELLKKAISEEFGAVGFDFSADFVEEALKQGKLLILLDGLDEVPKVNQDKVAQAIQNFASRYNKERQGNRVIASCRIAASRSGFTNFTDIELADFDDEQIQQFITNWFYSDLDQATKVAEKCWNLLNEGNYKSAKELAQTPLLLTFLCVVYDRTQSFPANRATLYRKALDILLEEWAAEKRIRHESIYDGLNTELEKILLAEIAYRGFVEDRLFFTREELVVQIQKFLEDSVDKPKYLDGKAVLTAIAVQQGILTERAEDIYSFSHLTVQEYLTAQYLSQNQSVLTKVISKHLTEEHWREVLLLVPSLLPNADDLLERMQMIAQQRVDIPKWQALLTWASKATIGSSSSDKPIAKRCGAILLFTTTILTFKLNLPIEVGILSLMDINLDSLQLVHCAIRLIDAFKSEFKLSDLESHIKNDLDTSFNLAFARLFANANIFNKHANIYLLINKLEALQAHFPDIINSEKSRKSFFDEIRKIWCKYLELNQELIIPKNDEIKALANYLYICELMMRCKDSALRVSRGVWESIENGILMPTPGNEP